MTEDNEHSPLDKVEKNLLDEGELHIPKRYDSFEFKPPGCCVSLVSIVDFEQQYIITNEELTNNTYSSLQGVFLYTEEDAEMENYVKKNYVLLDIITGEWLYLYLLEKPALNWKNCLKYWKSILGAKLYEKIGIYRILNPTKPFDKNESIKIANKLGVPINLFPCLVLLPPLKKLSEEEKLIIPIKEISKEYFRNLFATLKEIFDKSKNTNKYETYETVKINFDSIIQYLEEHSQKVLQTATTEYQIQGTNIFINSSVRRLDMSNQNNPNINIEKSNIASVTGQGTINTAIIEQYNFSPEEKQNLAEAAQEIQDLLNQLSKTYSPPNPTNNLKIATATLEAIEKNPTLKLRVINALKVGGTEAIKELLDNPAVNILMASIEGFTSAE
jgi:hypothetical protein